MCICGYIYLCNIYIIINFSGKSITMEEREKNFGERVVSAQMYLCTSIYLHFSIFSQDIILEIETKYYSL